MASSFYPKIGLALGSGGAKGLAHIGVLKTLEKNNIPIDYIAGSSIGALFGAHYAVHKNAHTLEDLILGFTRSMGFQLFDPAWKGGFIKGGKAEHFITEILKGATFEDLRIPYAAVATDLNTSESILFKTGDLVKAIRASISVPAFFQPLFYQKRLLSDGGLSNPVPVDIVRKMGADIVIAVNLDTVYLEKEMSVAGSISKIPLHSINILRHNLALHSVKTADIVISPKDVLQVGIVGWNYFFDNEKVMTIINAGEHAAEKMLPQIEEAIARKIRQETRVGKIITLLNRVRNF
jgi:NTE family protein